MRLTVKTCLLGELHITPFQRLLLLLAGLLLPICNAGAQNDPAAEQKFFALMNAVRAAAGLPLLKPESQLQESARLHLSQFVKYRQISNRYPTAMTMRLLDQTPTFATGGSLFGALYRDNDLPLFVDLCLQYLDIRNIQWNCDLCF